jgi:hypothetical protein
MRASLQAGLSPAKRLSLSSMMFGKLFWQVQTIRPGIKASPEVQNSVHPVAGGVLNQLVDDARPNRHHPTADHLADFREMSGDLFAALSGKLEREGITIQRLGMVIFVGPPHDNHYSWARHTTTISTVSETS